MEGVEGAGTEPSGPVLMAGAGGGQGSGGGAASCKLQQTGEPGRVSLSV